MPDSFLSFANSATFRDVLLTRNLPPYTITGIYTPPASNINTETQLNVTNVINSPDNFITDGSFANKLYPLNSFGPDGGYELEITYNAPPKIPSSNQGEYNQNDTKLDLLNETFIDAAYLENVYGPEGGFQDLVVITSQELNNKIYASYWDPPTFVPSNYTPYSILFSDNPTGSDGLLSQDSFIAQLGAKTLKSLLLERVAAEIYQNTIGLTNLEALQDPFELSLILSGKQPVLNRNWRVTVAENPLVSAINFASRLVGAYWPVSPIPGDYFDENVPNGNSQQTSNALNVVNQLTGGFLGPILNKKRNPSEIFLANTGNGQRSALFYNLDYNRYQPGYNKNFGGILGVAQGVVNLAVSLINDNGTLVGGYYVGSRNAEPSTITSPPNQVPVNAFGQQEQAPVYGPSELGILFEGNSGQLNFGLNAKSFTDGGSLDGEFVWVSPKYKGDAGYKPTIGGGKGNLDSQFNQISSNYIRDESTNIEFKQTSILDQTQRLVNAADNIQGISRLKHVGNAINQVSKVFNDGYKEMTKGSQIVSYKDNTTGDEKGIEYCRVFAKDTPYYTYADLQKTDGITISGRRFTNSVLDNTYNLNIAPLRGEGSTNIQPNAQGKIVAKKYMFSLENLAWRTSSRPGYTYDELPDCEKGPNGGRVMWFPPYNLRFSDSSTANWGSTPFLGRPEPIHTYRDTNRSGTLNWDIIVDSPSVMNLIVEKQLKGQSKEKINSIMDSFFAGCVKYDIYELAKKFNQIPTNDLFTYQQILNDPRLTDEQYKQVLTEIPADANDVSKNNINNNTQVPEDDPRAKAFADEFNKGFAFYFHNDIPNPNSLSTTTNVSFDTTYNDYVKLRDNYVIQANKLFADNLPNCVANPEYCNRNRRVGEFFDGTIIGNFEKISKSEKNFLDGAEEILKNGGTIELELLGAASAPGKDAYNKNLSQRRIQSVINYLEKTKLGTYMKNDKKPLTIRAVPTGETGVFPVSINGDPAAQVNCTQDIVSGSKTQTTNALASIYSTDAMACRRVQLVVKNAKLTKLPEPVVPKPVEVQVVENPKPQPSVEIKKKIKEGISKKILRQLLSECDYFEVIKEENPMVYNSIKDKVKYFSPAFHSMTPEGLNARLTFLNQCVRPGETIPIIGTDGKPKFNDAVNSSFGAPPVLVLRIGDFFNTKIIPKNLSFSYEPLIYDLNPEGIGVQPMIAKVQLSFEIIGGSGIARPVEQLQNALSFNFYANTEIYDERAVWTEDTSKLDKEIVNALTDGETPATVANVDNQLGNKGGDTIGTIVTNIPVESGQTGEITYQRVMDDLLNQSREYFLNIVNQLETINNNTENGSWGLVQLLNSKKVPDTNTTDVLDEKLSIYGKPDFQPVVDDLFTAVANDIDAGNNLILEGLQDKVPDLIAQIGTNMKNYLQVYKGDFSNNIATVTQQLVSNQTSFIQTIREVNLVAKNKIDGLLMAGNVPRVYNLSGRTLEGIFVDPDYDNSEDQLKGDFEKMPEVFDEYNTFLSDNRIVYEDPTEGYEENSFVIFGIDGVPEGSLSFEPDRRFFLIMSRVLTDSVRREKFLDEIITKSIEEQGKKSKVRKRTNDILNEMASDYQKFLNYWEKKFVKLKKENTFKELTENIENKLWKRGKIRRFDYNTTPEGDTTAKGNLIKDLYLNPPKF